MSGLSCAALIFLDRSMTLLSIKSGRSKKGPYTLGRARHVPKNIANGTGAWFELDVTLVDAESFRQLADVSTRPIYDKILAPIPWRCQSSGPPGNSAHWSWFEAPRTPPHRRIVDPTRCRNSGWQRRDNELRAGIPQHYN